MTKAAATFLQAVLVLLGLGVLVFLLWEPHLEGRNARATVFEVYFKDPFLAYVYLASILFFMGLHRGIRLLGYAGRNRIFSPEAVSALRTMKHCALGMVAFVAVSGLFIPPSAPADDDRPQGIVMRLAVAFVSIAVAAAAARFQRIVQQAVGKPSKNDPAA